MGTELLHFVQELYLLALSSQNLFPVSLSVSTVPLLLHSHCKKWEFDYVTTNPDKASVLRPQLS
jgi:hypothetical protein